MAGDSMTNRVGPVALAFSILTLITMLGEAVYAVGHYLLQ
jgi:hypothetical protein